MPRTPAFYCCGYRAFPQKGGGYILRWLLKNCNYHVPRKFLFHSGKEELYEYVQALLHKREKEAAQFEELGLATDHEYEQPPEGKPPTITLSHKALLAFLKGEMPLDVDEGVVLSWRSGSQSVFPDKLYPDMIKEGLMEEVEHARLVQHGPSKEVYIEGRLGGAPQAQPEQPREHSQSECSEHEILENDLEYFTERIFIVRREGHTYFARKLYIGDQLIWAGSGESAKGPWFVYYSTATSEGLGV